MRGAQRVSIAIKSNALGSRKLWLALRILAVEKHRRSNRENSAKCIFRLICIIRLWSFAFDFSFCSQPRNLLLFICRRPIFVIRVVYIYCDLLEMEVMSNSTCRRVDAHPALEWSGSGSERFSRSIYRCESAPISLISRMNPDSMLIRGSSAHAALNLQLETFWQGKHFNLATGEAHLSPKTAAKFA